MNISNILPASENVMKHTRQMKSKVAILILIDILLNWIDEYYSEKINLD